MSLEQPPCQEEDIQYWQIAAGSEGRDYTDDFLRYGMAFVGGEQNKKLLSEMKPGDRVVLKRGLYQIVAVGRVLERRGEGDKEWLRHYDGWQLTAYVYVEWHVPSQPVPVEGLVRATITRVHEPSITKEARDLWNGRGTYPKRPDLDPEPGSVETLSDGALLDYLQKRQPGISVSFISQLQRLRKLAGHYRGLDEASEHEIRTFLIIPLLLSLGWREEQIRIELSVPGGRVDIACNGGTVDAPRWVFPIETKSYSYGLDHAQSQVRSYAKQLGCKLAFVSNGTSYIAYQMDREKPVAYLNLLRPTKRYPRDPANVAGSLELLDILLPGS